MSEGPLYTLPDRAYHDPVLYEREVDEIFGGAWTLAGHISEAERPGGYVTVMVGREPVVVVRSHDDGELRALSNVCRHRASLLVEGTGTCAKVMRCPYHAWTYRLDGTLAAAPQARGFREFDRDAVRLPRFRVAELAGLIFVSTNPEAPPIEDVFGDLGDFLRSLELERRVVHHYPANWRGRLLSRRGASSRLHASRYTEEFQANWKVLADNYLEDYHVPVSHPGLARLLDVKATDGEYAAYGEWSSVPLRKKPSKVLVERLYQRLARPMPGLPSDFHHGWGNIHLWPATFFEIYPHHVDTWQLQPTGLNSTVAVTMTLVDPSAKLRDRLARHLCHRLQGDVMDEDTELTDRVQVGLSAPSYHKGILNDEIESSVAKFQNLVRSAIPEEDRADNVRRSPGEAAAERDAT
jgi:phenylpropionate dioxygenase-like ring-hydroxylating dioxygenase large terminal subunit